MENDSKFWTYTVALINVVLLIFNILIEILQLVTGGKAYFFNFEKDL